MPKMSSPNSLPSFSVPGQKAPRRGASKFFKGQREQLQAIPAVTSQQQGAMNQMLQSGLGRLGQLEQKAPFNFAPIANKARQGFQQQTVPSIAERFTSMGGQRSSAFPQILGQQAAGLESSLAALESDYGLKQRELEQSLLHMLFGGGLSPQFNTQSRPGTSGFLQNVFGGVAQSGLGLLGGGMFR